MFSKLAYSSFLAFLGIIQTPHYLVSEIIRMLDTNIVCAPVMRVIDQSHPPRRRDKRIDQIPIRKARDVGLTGTAQGYQPPSGVPHCRRSKYVG